MPQKNHSEGQVFVQVHGSQLWQYFKQILGSADRPTFQHVQARKLSCVQVIPSILSGTPIYGIYFLNSSKDSLQTN